MSIIYVLIFFVMCLAGGLKLRWVFSYLAVMGGGAVAMFQLFGSKLLGETQWNRIVYGFAPDSDPYKAGWQAIKSRIAIGAGRLTGLGLRGSAQRQLNELTQKESDFIFAICGLELGMVGCVALLLLLSVIIVRCLFVAARAKTPLVAAVSAGVGGMLLFQTIINVGMCLALTPVVGLTLPFFSYGGSSIVTMFAAAGLVSSAKRFPMAHHLKDE
jgi:rod shape determining protein RodA